MSPRLHKNWGFFIMDFFSKCDQISKQAIADLVLFTEEALNGKLHFLLGTFFHIYLRSHLRILIM